jgi:hypothetical protein
MIGIIQEMIQVAQVEDKVGLIIIYIFSTIFLKSFNIMMLKLMVAMHQLIIARFSLPIRMRIKKVVSMLAIALPKEIKENMVLKLYIMII